MIVRILGEGQFDVPATAVEELNRLDAVLEKALPDEEAFASALHELLEAVRTVGSRLPDDSLEESDAVLPGSDATAPEVAAMLEADGLIPG